MITDKLQIRNKFIKEQDKAYRLPNKDEINYTDDYVSWLEAELVKKLNIDDVSQQRELLLDFCNKKLKYNGVRMLDNEYELVDDYLKSNNCG